MIRFAQPWSQASQICQIKEKTSLLCSGVFNCGPELGLWFNRWRNGTFYLFSAVVLFCLFIYLFFVCLRYLTLREQKLMKRRKEAENLLEDKKKLLEWEKRLDQEEILVRNLLNEALKLESSRKIRRVSSLTSEDDEHRGKKPHGGWRGKK